MLADGGPPFGWGWWGALSGSNDCVQAAADLRELSCGGKEAKKKKNELKCEEVKGTIQDVKMQKQLVRLVQRR